MYGEKDLKDDGLNWVISVKHMATATSVRASTA